MLREIKIYLQVISFIIIINFYLYLKIVKKIGNIL